MRWLTILLFAAVLATALLLPLALGRPGSFTDKLTSGALASEEESWPESGIESVTQELIGLSEDDLLLRDEPWEYEERLADSQRQVSVLLGNEVRVLPLNEYLYGVVSGEMPASFPAEALRAQAVAARTYTLYKQAHSSSAHPQAQVCASSSCCKAFSSQETLRSRWGEDYEANAARIAEAVDSTDGLVMTYDSMPILAVFHSTSSGQTERSADIWGGDLPYLQSVDSPGETEAPRYSATIELTAAECKKLLLAKWPKLKLSSSAAKWFGESERSEAGGVLHLTVGDRTVTGGEVRKLFGLNSTNFTISANKKSVTITTKGYGHGVGLSQYGARAMALEGYGFEEILSWYYTGAELESVFREPE